MKPTRMLIAMLLCAMLMALPSYGQKQLYNFIHFTEKEGLPSNTVNGLALDSTGLLWLTSKHGLAYFDGARFNHVAFQQGTNTYSNYLGSLAIDKQNRIWMTTNDRGLLCYDRSKPLERSMSQFNALVGEQKLVKSNLYDVLVSSSGLIYFGGQETDLQVLNPQSGKVLQLPIPHINSSDPLTIYCIQEDAEGNLWIGTRYHGFICYNPKQQTSKQVDFRLSGENGVSDLAMAHGQVYLGYYDRDLVRFDPKTDLLQHSLLNLGKSQTYYDNFVSAIAYWPEENCLLVGHNDRGLWQYQLGSKESQQISWDDLMPILPQPSRIRQLLPVKEGYWMATENGLFFYTKAWNKINTLIPLKEKEDAIERLIAWEGETWYKTAHSFGQLDQHFQRISTYPIDGFRVSMMSSDREHLYFSTFENGVYVFDRQTKQVHPLNIKGEAYGFESADCNNVIPDTVQGEPVLWIGSWNSGLYQYFPNRQEIRLFDKDKGLPDPKVITVGKDHAGQIWLGMDGYGVLRLLNKTTPRFQQFVQSRESGALMSNTIFSFYKGQSGNFWFSSGASGIGRVLAKGEQQVEFVHFYDRNPYPWLYAVEMQEDGLGYIWVKVLDGVMLFNQRKQVFRHLLPGKGTYPNSSFKTFGFYLMGAQLLWMTDKGLVVGDLYKVHQVEPFHATPMISKLTILNEDQTYRMYGQQKIDLKANENNFSFSFSSDAQHLGSPMRYAYQLEGLDEHWVEASKDLQAYYNNLAPGRYVFKVRVGDSYGNWSGKVLEVPISLASYWYASWWFRMLMGMALLAAMLFFFLYRISQQKKVNRLQQSYNAKLEEELALKMQKIQEQAMDIEREKQEKMAKDYKQKLYESELKAIRSQMNPHFIFNVLNSIEAYVVENDSANASKLIQQFSTLSRIVLENSQFSIVSLKSELQLVSLYLELERERFDHAFDYVIVVAPTIKQPDCRIPSLLIQPLVENAVHHGIRHLLHRKGQIRIEVYAQQGKLFIDIFDNGVGFHGRPTSSPSSFKNSSFGIKGIQERLHMINENNALPVAELQIIKLSIENEGFSTLVRIILPDSAVFESLKKDAN